MASVDAPRTRRSFARLDKVLEVPNLIDIQRRSFAWLTDPATGGLRETIDDIKDTARSQLAGAGPIGISMRAIARHLAMTASAVHYYFPSHQALLDALIQRCEALGYRQLVAVIGDSANAASINLHASFGFMRVGTLRSVGFKFGRWVDSVLMQRELGEGARTLPRE